MNDSPHPFLGMVQKKKDLALDPDPVFFPLLEMCTEIQDHLSNNENKKLE